MQSPMLGREQAEMGFGGLRGLFRQRVPQASTGGGMQPRPFPSAQTGGGLQPMPAPMPMTGGELPPMQQGITPMLGGGLPPQQGLPGLFAHTGGGFQPRQYTPTYPQFGMDWGRLLGGRMY
jgi:hypothetical protein